MDIKSLVGKNVNIECTDGEKFNDYQVDCFTDAYDNCDPEKNSIDILKNEGAKSGITLYEDEIKNIEVVGNE